jgi:hypothetical protein
MLKWGKNHNIKVSKEDLEWFEDTWLRLLLIL